jgi:ABC-type nitrate/sulfonate/bicarbonate transport system permease component
LTEQPRVFAGADGLIRGLQPPRAAGSWLSRHPALIRVTSIGSFLLAWEYFGRSINPIFLSYPSAVLQASVVMLADGSLAMAFVQSMSALVGGFVLAIFAGIGLGLLMGRYRFWQLLFDPFVTALYNTPTVAIVPLIQLWLGFETNAKITIVFLSAIFPIIINTYAGVHDTSRGMVDVVRAFGANDRQVMAKVVLPGAVPFIMAGMRLAVGRAVIGVVVAEFFMVINGLGGLIILFSNTFNTAKLFVPVIVLVALGFFLTLTFRAFERRFATWKETERAN